MNDRELQEWVEHISMTSFGRPFLHQARFNQRLRSTGGRYFTKSHDIEISSLQLETFGKEEVEKIIKHELCHYHLHILKKGYQHRDQDFKHLLNQVGGTRFCQSSSTTLRKKQPYRYRLECVSCKTEYYRKKQVDIRKFACGKCRGKLKSYPLDLNNHS